MSDLALLQELPELLRADFCAFVVRCFATLYPGQLEMSDYIEVIASRLAESIQVPEAAATVEVARPWPSWQRRRKPLRWVRAFWTCRFTIL